MKCSPILFSGDLVRAILEGRKTQTRRPMKTQPDDDSGGLRCPFGGIGDRLWVRETFCTDHEFSGYPHHKVYYRSGPRGVGDLHEQDFARCRNGTCRHDVNDCEHAPDFRWRPSIHMPRWASRITLEITDVRVQRLMSISDDDAAAEGVLRADECREGSVAFLRRWEQAYGEGAAAGDPWVWALTFKRVVGGAS